MPITRRVNSKANVRRQSSNDLPFNPAQPVLNRYEATSTASQSVINLTFSVDQTLTDQFLLYVDGKLLRLGASHDYTFTSVDANNFSSQVTLTQSLPVNYNILAYKLGLKKESEFGTDNRFVSLYAGMDSGFQGFVDSTTNLMTATTTTGTPAAGRFYSTVVNRSPLPDFSQDLKPRIGVERIMVQQMVPLQNEFGPNNETVWSALNDTQGIIRFLGNWSFALANYGQLVSGSSVGDCVEVTFYGTGLNLLTYSNTTASTVSVKVDGVQTSANIYVVQNGLLSGRGYSINSLHSAVNGLTLGVHTVTLTLTAQNGNALNVYGFEILNESSSVKVQPGISYIKGQKYLTGTQAAFSYNSVATGTKGGRVLVYQNSDGSISQAWTATNASQANLTSADHTNEDMVRQYHWREFGANRNDDFSTLSTTSGSRVFTLDDGTTTLCSQSTITDNTYQGLNVGNQGVGTFFIFTFVGTGLDLIAYGSGGSAGLSPTTVMIVDGATISTSQLTLTGYPSVVKVVSGLPYGTHIVKFQKNTANGAADICITGFKVYQPKKPTLPSGTFELADYNVMANYAATTAGINNISTGVLRKTLATRETIYVGSWTDGGVTQSFPVGRQTDSTASGAYIEYGFYGTGFELRAQADTSFSNNNSILIDGSSNGTGLTIATLGAGYSITSTNPIVFSTAAGPGTTNGAGLTVTGLTMAWHKVRVTSNTANNLIIEAMDIITPVHSVKSNSYIDLQNALPVGSNSISDNRKTTPVKDLVPAVKAWAQAVGITSSPSTGSTSFVPMPDMSLTIKTSGGPLDISFASRLDANGISISTQIMVNGIFVGVQVNPFGNGGGVIGFSTSNSAIVPVNAGVHKVDIFWAVSSGTATASGTQRILRAREI